MKRSLMGSLRRLTGAGGLAVALVVVLSTAAQAAGPIHTKFSFTVTDHDICGFIGTEVVTGVDNFTQVFDSAGNLASVKDTGQFHLVFTVANGKSVEVSAAGSTTGTFATNADGTSTVTITYKGLPERISIPRGAILTRDAGIVTFIDTLDNSGNVISETVAVQSGPHPEVDSGGALFCQIFTATLT